jgi:hypothetical protein
MINSNETLIPVGAVGTAYWSDTQNIIDRTLRALGVSVVGGLQGAVGDGSTNDRAAFATADVKTGRKIAPPGTYRISSNLTLTGHWFFHPDALLKPDSGVTITITGNIEAGAHQIFDLSAGGSIVWSSGTKSVTASMDASADDPYTLTKTGGSSFAATDVGQNIIVPGAGVGGEDLLTFVASFTDTTHVELNDPAFTSVTDAACVINAGIGPAAFRFLLPEWWGADPLGLTDSSAAVQHAFDVPSDTRVGHIVKLQPGATYLLDHKVQALNSSTTFECTNAFIETRVATWADGADEAALEIGRIGTTTNYVNLKGLRMRATGGASPFIKSLLRLTGAVHGHHEDVNLGADITASTNLIDFGGGNTGEQLFVNLNLTGCAGDQIDHDGADATGTGKSPCNVVEFRRGKWASAVGLAINWKNSSGLLIDGIDFSLNKGGAWNFEAVSGLDLKPRHTEANGPKTANNDVSLGTITNCSPMTVGPGRMAASNGTQSANTHCVRGLKIVNSKGIVQGVNFSGAMRNDLDIDDDSEVDVFGCTGGALATTGEPAIKRSIGIKSRDFSRGGMYRVPGRFPKISPVKNYLAQAGRTGASPWADSSGTATTLSSGGATAPDSRYTADVITFGVNAAEFTYGRKQQTPNTITGSQTGELLDLWLCAFLFSRTDYTKSDSRIICQVNRDVDSGRIYKGTLAFGASPTLFKLELDSTVSRQPGVTDSALGAMSGDTKYTVKFGNAASWDSFQAVIWGVQLSPRGTPYLPIPESTVPVDFTPTYTPTNVTTDRSFDADTVAVAELADIVGTLIADLERGGELG